MLTKTINGTRVDYQPSTRSDKKFMTRSPEGKIIHFGAKGYSDYIEHKDPKRRENYQKRHSAILLKNGSRAIDKVWSPAWLSYHINW